MRVRDVMTRRPVTVTTATSLTAARRLLARHDIRHLPVVDDAAVVGVVSDRDLLLGDRQLADALGRLHSDLVEGRYRQIVDVMSAPAVTIAPDASVAAAARLLRRARISALPVVDADRLVGIVTTSDLVAAVADDQPDLLCGHPPVPLGPGDDRPGRLAVPASALVIDPDAATRMRLATDLTDRGYQVVTCPGPCSPTRCPAQDRPRGGRCPRLPRDIALIVVDQVSARTRLLDAYTAWAPCAQFEITG